MTLCRSPRRLLTCLPRRCLFVTDGHSSRVVRDAISAIRRDCRAHGCPSLRCTDVVDLASRQDPGRGARALVRPGDADGCEWRPAYRLGRLKACPARLLLACRGRLAVVRGRHLSSAELAGPGLPADGISAGPSL